MSSNSRLRSLTTCITLEVPKCKYCVQPGDTLHYINRRYNLNSNWLQLWNANGIEVLLLVLLLPPPPLSTAPSSPSSPLPYLSSLSASSLLSHQVCSRSYTAALSARPLARMRARLLANILTDACASVCVDVCVREQEIMPHALSVTSTYNNPDEMHSGNSIINLGPTYQVCVAIEQHLPPPLAMPEDARSEERGYRV